MDRREMLDTARRELAHIPDWPFHQRLLRMAYWNNRLHSLSKKSTYPDDPLAIIKQSIKDVSASSPGEKFEYDKTFFEEESRKRTKR
jgi:hypothetical protein